MTVVSLDMAYCSFREVLAGFDTRLDTPPSIDSHHPDSGLALRQRIKAGLKRAVAQGARLGRPKVDIALERKAQRQLKKGVGILKVAKMLGLGTGTVQRIKQEMG